jgi:2-amino-4-hydroxy-6-hydroxymethyldihydropteridine diphosphokinase
MARVFIGIGSNIEPALNIIKAIRSLCRKVRIIGVSTVYLTRPEDRPEQPPFYNCVIEAETEAPPRELKFGVLRPIEESLGRRRTADKSAARTIDLDIILYDDMVIRDNDLTVPDPGISRRAFIALPLRELSPALSLPDTGVPVAEIASSMDQSAMVPLTDYTETLRKEIFCRHGRGKG